jgi:hypothetical protein
MFKIKPILICKSSNYENIKLKINLGFILSVIKSS